MGRATATILFTDLVGSTELRGRLGEEAADELRRKHDQLLARAVGANNGRMVKGLGDGIMATFTGASDAVETAVAIQQAVDRLNRSGKVPVPLSVRVGLSAGDVNFEDDDVHGTPVIEAARLCGVAVGGEVLAAEVVRWLGGSQVAPFIPAGSLELKGLAAPVPAVRIDWKPAPASAVPMPALLTDIGRIFVGRDAELDRLRQLWKEAAAGERRVAFLAGEPGVGKTRLAAELAVQVHDEGGVVLAGRCDDDMGVPYQPFVEALRHFVDHTSPAELNERLGRYAGELVRLVPDLSQQAADLPRPLQSDPETERYRLFDAVAGWLSAASAEDALVLVLDDLQWAAKPTLLLLRHIVRASDIDRLLVLGTYRDTELTHDHPLVELMADLRREAGIGRFPLSGLDDLAVSAIVEQAAGHALDEDGMALARAIYRETEGNPFFVREVLRHLAETNAIEQEGEQWVTRVPIEELGIPEGIRDVIGRRLSRLSQEANQALRVAAVVGAEFDLDQVRVAGELTENRLLAALDEAVEARLTSELSPNRFRFSHALVRATLYESLTGARKVDLHRRVAEAIESLHGRLLDDYLPALAHHWARASAPAADTAKAVGYAARAGDRALAQLAHDEAVAYYNQALELLTAAEGLADDGRRMELLIALGEAQRRAGDPAHRETLLKATRLAADRGDTDAQIRAVLANSRGYFPSTIGEVDDEQVGALEAALTVGVDDTATRARLLAALGLELTYTGDAERRVRLADEALALARVCGDAATLAHVLVQRFFTVPFGSTLPGRLANSAELIPLAESLGDPVITAHAFLLRARCLFEAGEIEDADRWLDVAARAAGDLAQPTLRWQVGLVATARTILGGDLEEGERRARAGYELGQATGQGDAPTFLAAHLFIIRLEQGRLGELEELVAERVDAVPHLILLPAMLARLLCELDRPEEATGYYERVAGNLTRLPVDVQWMQTVPHCAVVCAQLGDRPRARVLFDLLTRCASDVIFTAGGALGARTHYLAVLATTLADFDEAERHFADAAATHERIGAPTWLARTRLEWARMLLTRRQLRDATRARELLRQAQAAARQLGLGKVERDAVTLLQ